VPVGAPEHPAERLPIDPQAGPFQTGWRLFPGHAGVATMTVGGPIEEQDVVRGDHPTRAEDGKWFSLPEVAIERWHASSIGPNPVALNHPPPSVAMSTDAGAESRGSETAIGTGRLQRWPGGGGASRAPNGAWSGCDSAAVRWATR
jgi:hypothetical protein